MTEQTEKPSSIRQWLARYKPTMVRCTLADNEQRELPTPKQGRGQWAHLERAITMLAPTYIEAYQGKTCVATRAMEVETEDDGGSSLLMPAEERKHPFATMIASMPTIVQLNVDAADRACERLEAAYRMAFEAQKETNQQYLALVKLLSDRLGGLERAWHKMIIDRASEMGGIGDQNDDLATGLIGTILNRNGANGAAKHAPAPPPAEEPKDD
jgi:hypothetical protein